MNDLVDPVEAMAWFVEVGMPIASVSFVSAFLGMVCFSLFERRSKSRDIWVNYYINPIDESRMVSFVHDSKEDAEAMSHNKATGRFKWSHTKCYREVK